MDHHLTHALRQFLAGAVAAALMLALAPQKAAADGTPATAGNPALKVFIPNPEAARQANDPSATASLRVLDQQLAREANVTDSTEITTNPAGTAGMLSARTYGNPMASGIAMPGPVQKIVSTLIAPLSASLSVVSSMLDGSQHLVTSMAGQWVESQRPAPTAGYAAAPQAAPQTALTTVSSVYPQGYTPAPARAAYPQDPAAAVFADNSQPVVVYYPSAPQPMAYYPPPQPYYPPQYYPPQPYYYPPQAYYQPAPAYAPQPQPLPQPMQVATAAPAPQYAAPFPVAPAYVAAAPQAAAPPVKPHAIITIASSPDPTFIVHSSSTGGTMPNSIVPPAVTAADYAQLAPAAGSSDDGAPPLPPINAPTAPARAQAPARSGPSVFEATVTGPEGTASNADGSTAAAATAAAPSPLLPSEGSEPEPELSPATRKAIAHIPSGIDSKDKEIEHLRVNHQKERTTQATNRPASPPLDAAVDSGRPHVDVQYDLQQGYGALIAGDTEAAIRIYSNVLENDPDNKQALFALGTAYQRVGQIDKARPYYIRLLKIDPTNRNALNNFLALAADEAPQDALRELQDLETRNPGFSPVPAQMAYIYEKLGMNDQAIENMLRAVTMEPENLTYRYNLAVMYDKAGKNQEAAELYKQIVSANYRGEHIPGNIETVQERLTFLSSNSAK